MEKNKKQIMEIGVLAVLIVVLITVMVRAVVKVKSSLAKKSVKTVAVVKPVAGTQAAVQVQGPAVAQTQSTGQAAWGVDPFSGRQIYMAQENTTELKVSGIVYAPENPKNSYAIINNSIVCVGQNLEGTKIKIKDISKDEVTIIDGAKEMKLKIW